MIFMTGHRCTKCVIEMVKLNICIYINAVQKKIKNYDINMSLSKVQL